MATIKEKVIQLERATETRLTVLWHEIEEWQQDNHFIVSGYRPSSNSYMKSAQSLGYIHNETVNVYTHLIGAVVALIASAWAYLVTRPRYETATHEDVAVFSCFFAGAAGCLGMSATFHLFSNHSIQVQKFGNQLDYLGIVFLIWGSFIPSIYYGFYNDPDLMKTYWLMITTIGLATGISTMLPIFRTPEFRPFRTGLFVAMGLSSVFPVLHGLQRFGYHEMERLMGFRWLFAQGVLYITGAAIYAGRIPERFSPGTFDIWGASHQIFHVLVLLAAAAHLKGLLLAFDQRHGI